MYFSTAAMGHILPPVSYSWMISLCDLLFAVLLVLSLTFNTLMVLPFSSMVLFQTSLFSRVTLSSYDFANLGNISAPLRVIVI